jgi:hypothetical protein
MKIDGLTLGPVALGLIAGVVYAWWKVKKGR